MSSEHITGFRNIFLYIFNGCILLFSILFIVDFIFPSINIKALIVISSLEQLVIIFALIQFFALLIGIFYDAFIGEIEFVNYIGKGIKILDKKERQDFINLIIQKKPELIVRTEKKIDYEKTIEYIHSYTLNNCNERYYISLNESYLFFRFCRSIMIPSLIAAIIYPIWIFFNFEYTLDLAIGITVFFILLIFCGEGGYRYYTDVYWYKLFHQTDMLLKDLVRK